MTDNGLESDAKFWKDSFDLLASFLGDVAGTLKAIADCTDDDKVRELAMNALRPAKTISESEPWASAAVDNLAVSMFAAAMKRKMAKSRAKGRKGWVAGTDGRALAKMFVNHIPKGNAGNMEDLACILAMMHFREDSPMLLAEELNAMRQSINGLPADWEDIINDEASLLVHQSRSGLPGLEAMVEDDTLTGVNFAISRMKKMMDNALTTESED